MRWDALFGDLEAQLDAADAAELAASVGEAVRAEVGAITVGQRLRAAAGDVVAVGTAGPVVRGRLTGVGPDWVLLEAATEVLVPMGAVVWVQGLGRRADVREPGRVCQRLGLRPVLRGLARDRATVRIACAAADPVAGTIDRVGADHLDLAVHEPGEPRRAGAVRGVRTIAFSGLAAVSRV